MKHDTAQGIEIEGVKLAKRSTLTTYEGDKKPRIYVDAADVARIIRKRLKAVFPGTRFSVTTSKYSGGASVDARWADGPTYDAVYGEISRFRGADFDGMIDLKTYRDDVAIGGYTVSWGADYVFANREISEAVVEAERAELSRTLAGFAEKHRAFQDDEIYRALRGRDLREGVTA